MKIACGNFLFAPGGDASPEGLRLNGKYEVQQAGYLRAAIGSLFPRGNQVNTVTFAITRDHASPAAAELFLFLHAAAMPTGGTFTFVTEQWEGAVYSFTATGSAVGGRDGTILGLTTHHEYTLLLGALTGAALSTTPTS